MRKTYYSCLLLTFCFGLGLAENNPNAVNKASQNAKSSSYEVVNGTAVRQQAGSADAREQASQGFDTTTHNSANVVDLSKSKTVTPNLAVHQAPAKPVNKQTGTLASPMPKVPATTTTKKQTTATQKAAQQTTQKAAQQPAKTTKPAVTKPAATTKQATAAKTTAAPKAAAQTTTPATTATLAVPPKANLKPVQRGNSMDLVQTNTLKQNATAKQPAQEEDPQEYARKRHVHLKDYQVEYQEPASDEEMVAYIIRTAKEQGRELTAEEREYLAKILDKRNLKAAREKWQEHMAYLREQEETRRANRGQPGALSAPKRLPFKKLVTDPVNNAILNALGATEPNSFTQKPFTGKLATPVFYTAQMQAKAKQKYDERQEDVRRWEAEEAVREAQRQREAQEAAAREAQRQREAQKAAAYANLEWNQICDPKIKNASSAACSMCCTHPNTVVNGFNPQTQEMLGGYIDSRDNKCHCRWQGKSLTGYDTRNTSDQACTAYCLAHPQDTKGFNPAKHQMHYGKLKNGQCQCHYISKDLDICSWKVSTKSDDACSRCCIARGANSNNFSVNFDPSKHIMTGGWVRFPGKSIRYCDCLWDDKPGLQEHHHAAVTGASVDALVPTWTDDDYTSSVCNTQTVNQSQVNCTKCCLAKRPIPPHKGYQLDFGYLNNGQCKCHFSNPDAGVCDNERKLASDMGCLACCEAQPPANFDPDTDEMTDGRVVGNNCECHWKTRPQQSESDSGQGCSFQEKNRSQSDCNRCCTDPSRGLVGGELESDGICVCLHR